jgi:hypothetical protein
MDKNDPVFVQRANDLNAQRLRDALTYLDNVRDLDPVPRDQHGANLTISIVTMGRTAANIKGKLVSGEVTIGYLTQVAAMFHYLRRKATHFRHIHVIVCDVGSTKTHREEIRNVSRIFTVISKYASGVWKHRTKKNGEPDPRRYVKELSDYHFCMRRAVMSPSHYILMVQDDARPRKQFFPVLSSVLGQLKPYRIVRGEPVDANIGYIKLFYPMKWQSVHFTGSHMAELVLLALFGGCSSYVLAVLLNYCRIINRRDNPHKVRLNVNITCIVSGALYISLLFVGFGRPYMVDMVRDFPLLHRVSTAPGCCIPAVVYPTTVAKDLAQYLEHSHVYNAHHLDHILDQYMEIRKLSSYLVEPSLIDHIGMVSTLNNGAKKAAEFIYI